MKKLKEFCLECGSSAIATSVDEVLPKFRMEIINYAITPAAQEALLPIGTYGPTLEAAAAKATPEQATNIVTYPQNIKDAIIQNDEEVAAYVKKYEERWQHFQLG